MELALAFVLLVWALIWFCGSMLVSGFAFAAVSILLGLDWIFERVRRP